MLMHRHVYGSLRPVIALCPEYFIKAAGMIKSKWQLSQNIQSEMESYDAQFVNQITIKGCTYIFKVKLC